MKTTRIIIFTLFSFLMLTFISITFAQDDSLEYLVRIIYFIPNDRQPKPDIDKMLDTKIKDAQRFFANQMEVHGFKRKTFRFESDENGNAIVHHVNGRHDDAYYQNPSFGSHSAANEVAEQFDMSKNIYYISLDSSSNFLDGRRITGWANGNGVSGIAFVTAHEIVPTIHELGHAFGLLHDYRSDFNAMRSYGSNFRGYMTTSFCAAEWLDAHRYFNPIQEVDNNNTEIQFHPPELIAPLTKIRLRITLTDPDGLHQVQLLHPQWFLSEGFNHLSFRYESTLAACQKVSGKQATVEFETRELVGRDATNKMVVADKIDLNIMDLQGNIKRAKFEIDIAPLIPLDEVALIPAHVPLHEVVSSIPDEEVISIPDKNLAAEIRKELGLVSEVPITNLNMLQLSKLIAVTREIKTLDGLESAIYLSELNLLGNQISDITVLSKLTNLTKLSIGLNKIRDITALKTLKHLRHLSIGGNSLSDITVLTSLPSLQALLMGGVNYNYEPIRDIRPVWELTQLQVLSLRFLRIRDISPLTKFTALSILQLDSNEIVDITPLAGLTGLSTLILYRNQISNVNPLNDLVNLRELNLVGNPIKNRKPLLELLRKNPDVKIFLKNFSEPLPVNLSHFRAEHTKAGVILKWTTESEVDNAGFNIYRSPTRDGEFKVITPTMIQGAGTTGERNEYTWTDTTAKPNTVYYYRIEDVSHAGAREQLATVRLRGLVSPSGKLTTRWADLKAQE